MARGLTLTALFMLMLGGCASESLRYQPWPPLAVDVAALTARYPESPAVVLQRTIRHRFAGGDASERWSREEYLAIAVLSDDGERDAVVAVPLGAGRLTFLRARVRRGDGAPADVTPQVVPASAAASAEPSDDRVPTDVYRVPHAPAGSIVEFSYGVASATVPAAARELISGAIPVARYHLEFVSERGFDARVHVYNRRAELKQDVVDGAQRIAVDLEDIAAARAEPLAPPPSAIEPWWALAVSSGQSDRSDGNGESWDLALFDVSGFLYHRSDALFAGTTLAPSLGACARNSRCAVAAALAYVDALSDLSSFAFLGELPPFKAVLPRRQVTSTQKALLLQRTLAQLGVQARYAIVARAPSAEADRAFPSARRGDHLLLQLDALTDASAPLYVDPSCEWCRLGQLPDWSAGRQTQVLLFGPTGDPAHSEYAGIVRWDTTPDTREQTPSVDHQTIDATLGADGSLHGRLTRELRGTAALARHLATRAWLSDAWQAEGERDLRAHAATARRQGALTTSWTKTEGRLVTDVGYDVAGYATVDGERLIVPLTFLHDDYDHDYSDETRLHDVVIAAATRSEDTLTVHVPSGWVVGALPPPATMHLDAADAAFEVSLPQPDTIRVRRILRLHVGQWGRSEYRRLTALLRELTETRRLTIVLSRPR